MAATEGVFGIITVNPSQKHVLLDERTDGKGWDLPGGRVLAGEDHRMALIREVEEETGLVVEIIMPLGEPLTYQEDTAFAYTCKVVGGRLGPTKEVVRHKFCTAEDLKIGTARVGLTEGLGQTVPLKLVGPEGRLGRMGRMVWDGLSIQEEPLTKFEALPSGWVQRNGIVVSDCKSLLMQENEGFRKTWRRLDPYSPTGFVEAA